MAIYKDCRIKAIVHCKEVKVEEEALMP